MKMKRDVTGRFRERPYWEIAELEQRSEQTITSFLSERYGFERIPVPTEALTVLIDATQPTSIYRRSFPIKSTRCSE